MPATEIIRNRLLAVIATVLAIGALKLSYPVTMPLAVAAFVMCVAWPLKPRLDRVLPPTASYAVTILVIFAVFLISIGIVYWATQDVIATVTREEGNIRTTIDRYLEWADRRGLPTFDGEQGYERLVAMARMFLGWAYTALGYLGIIAVLVILGLPEIPPMAGRLREQLDREERSEVFEVISEIAEKCRLYMGVSVITSLMTGAASAAWAFALGLDLALIWGVLNFLLNFIPVIGNIVGIVPPSLYAFVQFQSWTMVIVTFVGYAVIQIVISNFIYPMLQGKGMALPSVGIILALSFWGWIWGIAGALLAVPLTAGVVIGCQHFEATRRIAEIFVRKED